MTLKDQFETLRGYPIGVSKGNPKEIPTVERSDRERLCRNPLVSVFMITYNHEKFIRQAIDGIVNQKTDFEYELVIGEDCSTDRTREICFEYQRRYPKKIRVLWWHENLRKVRHPAGGNAARTHAFCRGEFTAFCEGDDYWTDENKLQMQVDVFRRYPNVGLCYTDGNFDTDGRISEWRLHRDRLHMPAGVIPGKYFCLVALLGFDPKTCMSEWGATMTCTAMVRTQLLFSKKKEWEGLSWLLTLGDLQNWVSVAAQSDVYFIDQSCARYHFTDTGACGTLRQRVHLDGCVMKIYLFHMIFGLDWSDFPPAACDAVLLHFFKATADRENFPVWATRSGALMAIRSCSSQAPLKIIFSRVSVCLMRMFIMLGCRGRIPISIMLRIQKLIRIVSLDRPRSSVLRLYEKCRTPSDDTKTVWGCM